ncbi:hypothetical protein MOO46_07580 (plasmid) [Apilactobacillus apisilvae]|uniref:Uncharacterized protein n=1 Tax=Apilactobacillus apisilvae TaxID=2923364 RepID=A0ABY4PK28_9LACO|nr:hypothetical protein [Apilactobacillus apisilvae]UQS85785.1 hypothetical protein MOO46_07580 [Apilactobacillus apisilvae]
MANKNEEQLKTMMSGQKTIDVNFKENGKKRTTKLKVQDPGTSVGLDILDLTDVGDQTNNLPEAYDLVMRNVIISPKMSYESLNKELPDKFQKKEITKTNSDGDKVTITMKFPDYRTALGIIFEIQKNNGGMNNKKVMTDICNNVIVDKDNKHVDLDFFDEGSDGAGLTFVVMSEVMKFLSAPVNYKGVGAIIGAAFQFSLDSLLKIKK